MKKRIIDEEMKKILPKYFAWGILTGLVVLDAFLDLIFAGGRGIESNILAPLANLLGINNPIFLTPFVLLVFFIGVKVLSFLTKKIDKVPDSEELILTILVIVYGLFDLWLVLFYVFDFRLFKSHFYLIPILIVVGIVYEWWAKKKI